MKILPFSDASIKEAIAILQQGGVVAHATETCYGLACDMQNRDSVAKVFAIKNRPTTQPISALFASVEQAKKYVVWNERAEVLAQKYLPGPLTIILPMRDDVPQKIHPALIANSSQLVASLGVRISPHPAAVALVTAFGSPLSTTSANIHGQPNPYSANDMMRQFSTHTIQPDLILDSGKLPQNPPSTVVDCTKEEIQEKRSGHLQIL